MIQIVVNSMHHAWSRILGTQSVSSSIYFRRVSLPVQHRLYVLVKRFAQSARFFCPIQNRDSLDRLWQNVHKIFLHERTVKPYFDQSDSVSFGNQLVHGFFDGFTYRTHSYDNIFRIWSAYVVKRLIASSCQFADFIHIFHYDFRNRFVVFIGGFSSLEKDIRILSSSPNYRMFRIQRSIPEFLYGVPIHQLFKIIISEHFDLLNFM